MPEVTTPMQVQQVKLTCDACGGEMLPNGRVLLLSNPQRVHACTQCGATKNVSGDPYPRVVMTPDSPAA